MRTAFCSFIILSLWISVAQSNAQKQSQFISFQKIPVATFGDNALPLVASASSGLPVSFKSSNPRVALVASDMVQIVGAGRALITAMQAGDSSFRAAKSVSRPLLVGKKSQSIDFLPLGEVSIATGEVQLSAVASSGLPVSFASSNPRVASVRGNTLKPLRAGQIKITARQAGNANFKAALPVRHTVIVTATPSPTPTPTPTPSPTPTPTPSPTPADNNSAPVATGSATLAAVPSGVKDYVLQGESVANLFFKNFSDPADAARTNGLFVTRQKWTVEPGRAGGQMLNGGAFAALKTDGSVVTWGAASFGGDSSAVSSQLAGGVVEIFSKHNAFAALKTDGSVVTWGAASFGGDSSAVSNQLAGGVAEVFGNNGAFAALKTDGSVVTWGDHLEGGDSSVVSSQLLGGVVEIFGGYGGFAALKADGSVVTWGLGSDEGQPYTFDQILNKLVSVADKLSSGVVDIVSAGNAFAALKTDGSVVTWGDHLKGGDSLAWDSDLNKLVSVADKLSSGVVDLFSNDIGFAALKTDGSVVTWGGNTLVHYDASSDKYINVADKLSSGVVEIFSSFFSFAALKADGSVVNWGSLGGKAPYYYDRRLKKYVSVADKLSSGVVKIFAKYDAFAALKTDGSVVTWGDSLVGGDSGGVRDRLISGVLKVFPNGGAFAALKSDGSVLTWGDDLNFGSGTEWDVRSQVSRGVAEIFSTGAAFAALKTDGSVVSWGDPGFGGYGIIAQTPWSENYASVTNQLTRGVVSLATPSRKSRLVRGNALAGVAVTANMASSLQGKWQFSTNGFHWIDVPANLSPGAALVLQNDTQLRFAPAPSFAGTPGGLTVQLIETGGAPLVSGLMTNAAAASGGANRISIDSVQLNTLVR